MEAVWHSQPCPAAAAAVPTRSPSLGTVGGTHVMHMPGPVTGAATVGFDHSRQCVCGVAAIAAATAMQKVSLQHGRVCRRRNHGSWRQTRVVVAATPAAASMDAEDLKLGEDATTENGQSVSESTLAQLEQPHVVVVGAGWGGWGAAKALHENGCRVTMLDGMPDPTGATPFLTPSGKPFEVGTRGFWKDYPNIENLLAEIDIDENEVFTEFTESSFFGPQGLEATAPVFSSSDFPELPSPLGQVVASFERFKRLPLADRATMAGLLYAMIDFTRDARTFEAYDRMTAHELFLRMGVSKRLVDDFIRPTLLVGLFKPPEELSAAVAMELLYFYALAHQNSFDVRWMKKATIQESIVCPLATKLQSEGVSIFGGCRATELTIRDGRAVALRYTKGDQSILLEDMDAVVLAVGAKGLSGLIAGSPGVARRLPELAKAASMPGIDVVATRIWLDRYVSTETPANVLSRFDGLRDAGGTFFMLDQLQDDQEALWGGEEPQGSVIACDFYNAGAIASMSNADIVELLMRELLPAAVPAFAQAEVVDSHVVRGMGAVTWFSPGSYRLRPPLETSVPNIVCAGDWVRMGAKEHGAKGLCQERAFVSGLEAANALARNGTLGPERTNEHAVIPIRDDEPQVIAGRSLNATVMKALEPIGLASPWVR